MCKMGACTPYAPLLGSAPGYLCTYKYIDVQNIVDRYKMAKYLQTLSS